jgi:hypothetical protein
MSTVKYLLSQVGFGRYYHSLARGSDNIKKVYYFRFCYASILVYLGAIMGCTKKIGLVTLIKFRGQ